MNICEAIDDQIDYYLDSIATLPDQAERDETEWTQYHEWTDFITVLRALRREQLDRLA